MPGYIQGLIVFTRNGNTEIIFQNKGTRPFVIETGSGIIAGLPGWLYEQRAKELQRKSKIDIFFISSFLRGKR
ncbi:MAG: hypothetical protein WDO19_31995 [Bacteroidota bacterium]